MKCRIKEAASRLLGMFETGMMPEAIARTMIRREAGDSRPCDEWSLGNQILMISQGSMDARGFKQWNEVGRHVKKGAKAIHILGPVTKTVKKIDEETEEAVEKVFIKGFRSIPVFRYEDTDGSELIRPDYEPVEYPPLWEAAKRLGFDVRYEPSNGSYWGSFHLSTGDITLHTHDPKTFYHELAHAVHGTFTELKGGQDPVQEIVAETTAAVLLQLQGITGYERYNFDYIRSYCRGKEPAQVVKTVMNVLADVEKVIQIILEAAGDQVAA